MMLYQPVHDDNHHHDVKLHDCVNKCTAPQVEKSRQQDSKPTCLCWL